MAYDSLFIAYISISLAAAFMALVLISNYVELGEMLGRLAKWLGSDKKAAQYSKLDEMTQAADRAMAARERGERPGRMVRY